MVCWTALVSNVFGTNAVLARQTDRHYTVGRERGVESGGGELAPHPVFQRNFQVPRRQARSFLFFSTVHCTVQCRYVRIACFKLSTLSNKAARQKMCVLTHVHVHVSVYRWTRRHSRSPCRPSSSTFDPDQSRAARNQGWQTG